MALPRRKLTKADRALILSSTNGRCACCGEVIGDRPWEADHVVERSLEGADDLSNFQPLLYDCHKRKTRARAPVLAKVRRIIKKSDPATRKAPTMKSKPFFRHPRLKRNMGGKVVSRRTK